MRILDIIEPLYEAASDPALVSSNALHTVNYLSSVTDKIPEENGENLVQFNNYLEKIIDGIDKFTSYFKAKAPQATTPPPVAPHVSPSGATTNMNPKDDDYAINYGPQGLAEPQEPTQPVQEPEEEPVQEGVKYNRRREFHFPDELAAAKANLQVIKDEIVFLEKVVPESTKEVELRDRGLQFARQQLESATKTFAGFKAAVDERNLFKHQKEEADKFLQDIAKFLTILGDRVQGFSEGLESIDTTGLKSAEKKKIVNAQQFTSTLRQALFGLIIEIANGRETDVTPEQIKGFLQACVNGQVIDMNSVVSKDAGNIRESLNPEWTSVFDLFVDKNIFEYSPGKTSGAVGPGEMALSMMANPTEKAPVGDLMVSGVMYEVKAGKKTGGRLNSKGIGKATTGWKIWSGLIEQIVKENAPNSTTFTNTDNKGNPVSVKAKGYSANEVRPNQNKNTGRTTYKVASKYNWNAKGFNALNNEVLVYSTRAKTVELFVKTLRSIFNNYDSVKKHMETLGIGSPEGFIGAAISKNGQSVSLGKMNKAITAIAFVSYHLEDHIENILFLNTLSLDYTIIRGEGGDPTDLLDKLDDGTVIVTSGFNWNDAQQTPTPSYNTGGNKS